MKSGTSDADGSSSPRRRFDCRAPSRAASCASRIFVRVARAVTVRSWREMFVSSQVQVAPSKIPISDVRQVSAWVMEYFGFYCHEARGGAHKTWCATGRPGNEAHRGSKRDDAHRDERRRVARKTPHRASGQTRRPANPRDGIRVNAIGRDHAHHSARVPARVPRVVSPRGARRRARAERSSFGLQRGRLRLLRDRKTLVARRAGPRGAAPRRVLAHTPAIARCPRYPPSATSTSTTRDSNRT